MGHGISTFALAGDLGLGCGLGVGGRLSSGAQHGGFGSIRVWKLVRVGSGIGVGSGVGEGQLGDKADRWIWMGWV